METTAVLMYKNIVSSVKKISETGWWLLAGPNEWWIWMQVKVWVNDAWMNSVLASQWSMQPDTMLENLSHLTSTRIWVLLCICILVSTWIQMSSTRLANSFFSVCHTCCLWHGRILMSILGRMVAQSSIVTLKILFLSMGFINYKMSP